MYRKVYRPDHHKADVTGMVAEHVLIAEKVLGRPIGTDEIVHHMDFNKLNNNKSNLLFPISRQQHQQLPEYQARFIIAKGLYGEFLAFWEQAQLNDATNKVERDLEKRLVRAQNEAERLKGKQNDASRMQNIEE